MIEIRGITISSGTSIGFLLNLDKEKVKVKEENKKITELEKADEISKLELAFKRTEEYIHKLIDNAKKNNLDDKIGIFEAQLLLLDGKSKCIELINENNLSAYESISTVFDKLIERTKKKKNKYLASRADDIGDLKNSLLEATTKELEVFILEEDTIISLEGLLPSHTMSLDLTKVKGFIVSRASLTSHASIISKSLKIPLIQINEEDRKTLKDKDNIIITKNLIIVSPDESSKEKYQAVIKTEIEKEKHLQSLNTKESKTLDGIKINLFANIGTELDSQSVKTNQGEGVGLFRSEFLFLKQSQQPTEDQQYSTIKKVIENIFPYTVTIRTLDIGGDKEIPYLNIKKEENSFLGVRGVRLYQVREDIAKPHFRAILRQTENSSFKLMVPMISTLDEIIYIKNYIEQVVQELKGEGYDVKKENLKLGIMVETPSAALLSNHFIEHVDFFSIGSNDLTQYTLAVDRVNTKLSYLYSSLDPSVLKLIHHCVMAVEGKKDKDMSVCGEMAGTIEGSIILLALGVKTLSMTSSSIASIKNIVLQIDISKLEDLKKEILENCKTSEEVLQKINKFRSDYGIV